MLHVWSLKNTNQIVQSDPHDHSSVSFESRLTYRNWTNTIKKSSIRAKFSQENKTKLMCSISSNHIASLKEQTNKLKKNNYLRHNTVQNFLRQLQLLQSITGFILKNIVIVSGIGVSPTSLYRSFAFPGSEANELPQFVNVIIAEGINFNFNL